jgi:phage-related protein
MQEIKKFIENKGVKIRELREKIREWPERIRGWLWLEGELDKAEKAGCSSDRIKEWREELRETWKELTVAPEAFLLAAAGAASFAWWDPRLLPDVGIVFSASVVTAGLAVPAYIVVRYKIKKEIKGELQKGNKFSAEDSNASQKDIKNS